MVRKRSWPAVSHCPNRKQPGVSRGLSHRKQPYNPDHQPKGPGAYYLQLDDFSIELHGANFLRVPQDRSQANGMKNHLKRGIQTGSSTKRRATHEVHADCGDVTLSVCVVLWMHINRGQKDSPGAQTVFKQAQLQLAGATHRETEQEA
jgi:hypothetical protein